MLLSDFELILQFYFTYEEFFAVFFGCFELAFAEEADEGGETEDFYELKGLIKGVLIN